ncbi:MAG: hypothetical protein E7326_01485 [Clostridiales bacterium]|nr:hypothetical protein [Clostridiales bacterium]
MFDLDPSARDYGVTVVENLFIREYLPAAKGDYVKVYLWGLHKCQHPEENYGTREMAAELEMTLPQVQSALRYWERRGLVTCVSQEPEVYMFHSPMQRKTTTGLMNTQDSEFAVFAESVYTILADKRKVSPNDISRMWEWVQDIGLPPEAVLMLISHTVNAPVAHFSMKRMEGMALLMKENKVQTVEDAEMFLRNEMSVHKGVQELLRHLGKRSRFPSEDEMALYRKWRFEWQFDQEALLSACRETVKGEPTFAYLDGILKGIRARSESRTGGAVDAFLQEESDEGAKAQEVMDALGMRASRVQAVNFYRQWRRHMPHDVVLCAASLCHRTRDKAANMEDLLSKWQDMGMDTMDKVQPYVDRLNRLNAALRKVFEALGYRSAIAESDRLLYEKWESMGFDEALILEGAAIAHGAEGNKLRYMDALMENWHRDGVRDLATARSHKTPDRGRKPNNAQNYTQRQYTEQDLAFDDLALLREAEERNG